MGAYAGPEIVNDGLVLHLDAANEQSYPGSGSTLFDLSGNENNSSLSEFVLETSPVKGIKINDPAGSSNGSDTGRINCPTLGPIKTIELFFFQYTNSNGNRYLLDKRTGGGSGWIYNGGVGSNWSGGKLFINGEFIENIDNGALSTIESYSLNNNVHVVVEADSAATDDINLFSRYTDNETLGVIFYSAKIYNRALSEAEITQNFNALRGRYGI